MSDRLRGRLVEVRTTRAKTGAPWVRGRGYVRDIWPLQPYDTPPGVILLLGHPIGGGEEKFTVSYALADGDEIFLLEEPF